jgi:hypothetical protein
MTSSNKLLDKLRCRLGSHDVWYECGVEIVGRCERCKRVVWLAR